MKGSRQWLACAAAASLAVTLSSGAAPAHAQNVGEAPYALPEQELAASIREVARLSGRSIVAPSELVAARRAPPLNGRFSPETALSLLLEGSGLIIKKVDGALVIARPDGNVETRASEDIVVTGTNLRGSQPTSPLIVIRRQEIDRIGATSVEQLMRTVPQNTQGGVNQENAGVVLPDQDVSDHGAGLNLRGLGQRATLVLVNGRRLAPSGAGAFVDVSLIPLSSVERVEILTDGASAIYGSDAVGGVVNFILRDSLDGLETSLQGGSTTRGGGEQLQLVQTGGTSWGGGSAMLAYEYRLENEVRARQRPLTIGLRPSTFLLPRERRHSLLGTAEQEMGEKLRLGLTASFARRTTERTTFQLVSPLPIGVDARATSVSIASDLSYELPAGWRARLDANYALSTSSQDQTQPGGLELVNSRDVRNSIFEASLHLDGRVIELPAGAVRLALGIESRWEDYRDAFRSSAIAEVVDKADRTARSAFAELLVPVFSQANRRPGLERLQLSAAARYDRYSRTGSSFDPKLGLLWSPARGLDLRGSYSTSFRAPLLSEITGAYTAIYLPARFLYADPAQAPAGSIGLFLQGSNPDVRPETSRTWSLGGDFAPTWIPGLKLTANYYRIRFSNRIGLPTPRVNVIGNPAFAPIIDLDPDVAALTDIVAGAHNILDATGPGFSNGGATPADVDVVLDDRINNTAVTTTRGLDIGLRYGFNLGPNAFVLDANVNHIIDFKDRLTIASPAIRAFDRPYRPLDWRARGGLGWSRAGWTANLFVNHADAYRDDRRANVFRVKAHTTIDASLSRTFGANAASWLRGTRIALFAENLLDKDPPRLAPDPGSTTGLGYDPVNASARGRLLAIQLRRSW